MAKFHLVVLFVLVYLPIENYAEKKTGSPFASAEKKLAKDLHRQYESAGRDGRPVKSVNVSTEVNLMFGLMNMDLDEAAKVLTTSMWVLMVWKDEYLTWDPQDYSDIQMTRLENDVIWNPDVILYNTAEPETKRENSLLTVTCNGTVRWHRHQIYKSFCFIKVPDFPFDNQLCYMQFGSWTHTVNEINLTMADPMGIDRNVYHRDSRESTEWNITHIFATRQTVDNAAVITYGIFLRRKVMFSSYILTLPCIFLASLTLVVFCIPPERPDRTGLGMSIFASFLVLLLILVEAAPSSASSVPKLGIYYCFNMVIIILSIFLSSCVLNIHRAGVTASRIPYYIRVVFLSMLGRVLLVKTCESYPCECFDIGSNRNKRHINEAISMDEHPNPRAALLPTQMSMPNGSTIGEDEANTGIVFHTIHANSNVEHLLQMNLAKLSDLKSCLAQLLSLEKKKEKCSIERQTIILEWQMLAQVIDRSLCVIYLGIIIGSLIFLFPTPPFMQEEVNLDEFYN